VVKTGIIGTLFRHVFCICKLSYRIRHCPSRYSVGCVMATVVGVGVCFHVIFDTWSRVCTDLKCWICDWFTTGQYYRA